ncbi:MAG: TonB-dependent receptor, partial [Bacteroidota bacterium]
NAYGYYSMSLPPGKYSVEYSYLGYQKEIKIMKLEQNKKVTIELSSKTKQLEAVEVYSERKDDNIKKAEMSVEKIEMKQIKQIPALMGEVDVVKAIQLLPGVSFVSEGSSNFSVRGGTPDQNLILLDEAPVYNASHLMGFFSVFNNDAVKNAKLYKGDIPPRYGGRLSSLLDIRMKEGNSKEFSGSGGIGLISSRLTLEAPLFKDKSSFIVAGRRTYADIFLPLANEERVQNSKLYFYDLNAKYNHEINDNNRFFVSGYFGRDVFKNEMGDFQFGNQTMTTRWNHLFNQKLFSNFTAIYSKYDYFTGTSSEGRANSFTWDSYLEDFGIKEDMTWFVNEKNKVRFGLSSKYHIMNQGVIEGNGEESLINTFKLPIRKTLEHGIYISNEQKLFEPLTFKYGARYSLFQNLGPDDVFLYNDQYQQVDSLSYGKNEVHHHDGAFEPRLGMNFVINDFNSVKASYSRTTQYIQLASNSTAGMPLDIWFPASPNTRPQHADQYAIGYFRNFREHTIETSMEVFYKDYKNVIDFKDFAELLLNEKLEGELRYGKGRAYGLELMVRKNGGRFNGWVGYTLSRSERKVDLINDGKYYLSPYDKPHNLSVVLNYQISPQVVVSANWVYASGLPATFPVGRTEMFNKIVPVYSDRNAYRFPDYHRMDLSVTIKPKPDPDRFWEGEWNFSVYNVYDRHNAWTINFVQDQQQQAITYAEKTYLFPILPTVTYNFKF